MLPLRKKEIENKNLEVENTRNGWIICLSNCAVCSSKKSRFIKELEASGFLTALLGAKSTLGGILVFGNII